MGATYPPPAVLDPRAGNAVLRRVRAWTEACRRLDRDLRMALTGSAEAVELLAGVRRSAVVRAPHRRAAADLFVLLDQGRLYAGRELGVVSLGDWTYRITDPVGVPGGPAGASVRAAARQLTERITRGRAVGYHRWTGRIDRIAVITHNRPETLAGFLDAVRGNLRRFGRGYVEIVVYDDSIPAVQRRVRAVATAARAGGVPVRYVGPREKLAMRAAFERALPARVRAADRRVLDRLLGVVDSDGTWAGSAAEQRNWAILSAAGRRVLVCDDDIRPEVLDAPLADQRAAARAAVRDAERAPHPGRRLPAGQLLADGLDGHRGGDALVPWPTDLLGILEEEGAGLVSAAYTGHPDRRSALLLERFFELTDDSIDVCDTDPPQRHVRQCVLAAGSRKFRGGAFATSGSVDGVEFAVRRGRNEDFSLALSQLITAQGRLRPRESGRAYLWHDRGPRHCGPFAAHRQEGEGDLVNRLIDELAAAYRTAHPGAFDPLLFQAYGVGLLDGRLAGAAVGLAEALFRDGLAYRARCRTHLRLLADLDARVAAASDRPLPGRLLNRWYGDRSASRAALLRAGARLLAARRALPTPVLAECAQVLVPEGIMSLMEISAMRRDLRALPGRVRAAAVRCLRREARWYAEAATPPPRPVDHEVRASMEIRDGPDLMINSAGASAADAAARLRDRIRAKEERTRGLIAEIDTELGIRATEPDDAALGSALVRFTAGVRARVGAEVRLFLRATPYAYRLRDELPGLAGAVR